MPRLVALLSCLLFVSMPVLLRGADADRLAQARRLLLTGRYEEAAERYVELAEEFPVAGAIGVARCRRAVGRWSEADAALAETARQHPADPDVVAEQALWALERGEHATAATLARRALVSKPNQLTARWVAAELDRAGGRLVEAEKAYAWFIDYYNGHERFTADQLRWIGRAAARYARWKRNSAQFRFLVHSLYPQTLRLEPQYWPAHLEAARLFSEKYNARDAKREVDAALAINGNAAELFAMQAELALQTFDLPAAGRALDRALEINPRLLRAHQLRADCLLASLRPIEAIGVLEAARRLNPMDEGTLGRLAAAYGAVDGLANVPDDSRMGRLVQTVGARNEQCGRFYMALADSLDRMRRYPAAARYYREAERRMPRLMYACGRLGLMQMRLGREAEAARLLERSFAMDPFNVRVKNMLEVLDVLDGYDTIETDHFIIRYDPQHDRILAEYAARFLERQVYRQVTGALGYEPPGKSLFEIFSRARGTSGHAWFSARMVGLPYIGTVGACAGRVVAMASPSDLPKPYDWSRVLGHEFVHVVSLQQTDFAIPHWLTEGLAVRQERRPRPALWNQVLAQRAKADALFDLDTITSGFIRPADSQDWALAYCQAELYVAFMTRRYGSDATARLLRAYAEHPSTPHALKKCFGVDQGQFEDAYRQYVSEIVDGLKIAPPRPRTALSDLHRAVEQDPDNADAWAELAYQYLQRGEGATARRYALAARQRDQRHQLAAYVLARLYVSIGDAERAGELLAEAVDREDPQPDALGLLAALKLKSQALDEAERLYQLGAQRYPDSPRWLKGLSRVHLLAHDDQKLAVVLGRLAEIDRDNVVVRKKLVELAIERQDFEAAVRWANQAIHIDVMDAEIHASLAEAMGRRGRYAEAAGEYETAVRLSPDSAKWRQALAEARRKADLETEADSPRKKVSPEEP